MTAELADCFATKREGVAFVLDAFRSAFPGVEPWVYGIDGRFRSANDARQRPLEVAASNWRASATLVARTFDDALFIDVGSTTTDIIPVVSGSVTAEGTTDPARLLSGELVYTGALRTPVCAIVRFGAASRAPVSRGRRAFRDCGGHPSLAGTDRRGRLHVRDAGRPRSKPGGIRRADRTNGLRRFRDARSCRHHRHRGACGAGAGEADQKRHSTGHAASRAGLSPRCGACRTGNLPGEGSSGGARSRGSRSCRRDWKRRGTGCAGCRGRGSVGRDG